MASSASTHSRRSIPLITGSPTPQSARGACFSVIAASVRAAASMVVLDPSRARVSVLAWWLSRWQHRYPLHKKIDTAFPFKAHVSAVIRQKHRLRHSRPIRWWGRFILLRSTGVHVHVQLYSMRSTSNPSMPSISIHTIHPSMASIRPCVPSLHAIHTIHPC